MTANRSYSYIASGPGNLISWQKNNQHTNQYQTIIIIKTTYEKAEPLFSFSVSFKAGVVKGAIFRDAGKRIAVSIFRAEDLSFVLCSNLCREHKKEIMVSLALKHSPPPRKKGSEEWKKFDFYFELKAQDRWQLFDAQPFACFLYIHPYSEHR